MQTIELHPSFMSGSMTTSTTQSISLLSFVLGPYRATSTPFIATVGASGCMRPLLEPPSASKGGGFVNIMKGTPPVNIEDMQKYSDYADDILISYDMTNAGAAFVPTQPLQNVTITEAANYTDTIKIGTVYKAAIASGEATWVWICNREATGATIYTDRLYHNVIGTVGNMSSGADLVIPNVNIVSGKLYRIVDLKMQLPLTFTY